MIALLSLSDPNGGLLEIPLSFLLKNQLHLKAHELAKFRVIASIPLYCSFIFGLSRDIVCANEIWDRAILATTSILAACVYLILAFQPLSYTTVLLAAMIPTTLYLCMTSAQSGLAAAIGQQHEMSGQISAVWNTFDFALSAVAFIIGGQFSGYLEARGAELSGRILFFLGAGMSFAVFIYSGLRPNTVFAGIRRSRKTTLNPAKNLLRLIHHAPVYPALIIWLLWNFSPGSVTPLQYYLQDRLGASDGQWGLWNGIFTISFVPTFVLYGLLSPHLNLKSLLWWGTIIAIPQFVPLLFVTSLNQALCAATLIGMLGGIATAAYLDLIIRSCPEGLEGTMVMMAGGLYIIATRLGDIIGTYLYDIWGDFRACVVVMTGTYCLIPFVLWVSRRKMILTSSHVVAACERSGDNG